MVETSNFCSQPDENGDKQSKLQHYFTAFYCTIMRVIKAEVKAVVFRKWKCSNLIGRDDEILRLRAKQKKQKDSPSPSNINPLH